MKKLLASLTVATAAAATLAMSAPASAQVFNAAASIDLGAIHTAYFNMPATRTAEALRWFEEQANRYYYGPEYVSIAAQRIYVGGQPTTQVSGYIDRDGIDGLNPNFDQVLFSFVPTRVIGDYRLAYRYIGTGGQVIWTGIRWMPRRPFYTRYYLHAARRFRPYWTARARLIRLRTWRATYRRGAAYRTHRTRFIGRVHGRRHARVHARPAVRASIRTSIRTTVRPRAARRVRSTVRIRPSVRPSVRTRVRTRVRPAVRASVRTSVRVRNTVVPRATRTSRKAVSPRGTVRVNKTRTTRTRTHTRAKAKGRF